MKKILLSLSVIFITSCSSVDSMHVFDNQQAANLLKQHLNALPTQERIALNLPNKRNWQRIDLSYGTLGTPIMLIPTNEEPNSWTQSFRSRISGYRTNPTITPEQFATEQVNYAKENCAHTNGGMRESTKAFAIYQIEMSDCRDEQNQTQIGKAMKGSDAVYLVSYSAATSVSMAEFDKMARVVKGAQLVVNRKS